MMEMKTNTIYKKLLNIQVELKAPKNQYNAFGKYNYRNSEDILEALKPLLEKNKVVVLISDKPILIGNRFYIESTVKFVDTETGEAVETTAMAREEENKKGMDSSQITGSASSYARKYALNGMFCIDDTKDADNDKKEDNKKIDDKKPETTETKKEACNKQEYLIKVKKILWEVSGKNKEKSIQLLQQHTAFKGKDGKQVAGVTDFEKLSIARLQVTYGNLKKLYPQIAERVKKEFEIIKKKAV